MKRPVCQYLVFALITALLAVFIAALVYWAVLGRDSRADAQNKAIQDSILILRKQDADYAAAKKEYKALSDSLYALVGRPADTSELYRLRAIVRRNSADSARARRLRDSLARQSQ